MIFFKKISVKRTKKTKKAKKASLKSMAHQEGQESDGIPENWLSGFEDQCLEDFDSETNMEDTIQRETEYSLQKLFSQFQNSATAIAQLYKGTVK